MSNIPDGWIYTLLSEIASIQMGQSPDSRSYNEQGEGLPFFQGKAEFGKLFPTVRKWCTDPKRIAEAGDILLSVRAPVGPTNLAVERCCIGRGLAAIQAISPFNQKYLLHHFRNIEPWLSQQGKGSTFAAISGDFIRRLEIPVAPLNEQKRIVDKLDALLARVDACRARLDRVPRLLKRFRQSILAAATSGHLIDGEWDQIEDSEPISLRLAQITEQLKTGPFGSTLHKSDYICNGIPVVNPMHINAGRIIPTNEMTVSEEKAEELREYRLRKGDIVLARRGVMGRCAVVGVREQGWLCGSGSMIIRTTDQVLPEYLQIVLSSPEVVKLLEANAVGSTMVNLNQAILLGLIIPVPNINLQELIIHHVNAMLACAARLEARYQNALRRVERLTSALLSTAFRGELVLQDPNDEPTLVLLEHIRMMRATAEATVAKPRQRKPTSDKPSQSQVVMLKRKDIKPSHLSNILKARGSMTAETLWSASQLEIDDFYDQLKDEEANGLLMETREESADAPRLLESV